MSYLDELLGGARARIVAARAREPLPDLRTRALLTPPPPSFRSALSGPGVAVIAEVKRASPSTGELARDLDPVALANAYRDGGAAATSVLTEPSYFRGSLSDLTAVSALGFPTLCKDFIVHHYQVWQARAAGAAAVLLIVAALHDEALTALFDACAQAGVDTLVEVHDAHEAGRAVDAGATLVGVNARDLRTLEVDRDVFATVRPHLPANVLTVAESGMRGPDDVLAAARAGADAVLVGESLITAPDPRASVALLVSAGATPLTASEYR
ncbi:MAG: indole-3-glycerol phosphate synthase TrpC [Actinomycetota bacterium]|nr:indole-3-glycerol phosphate synthase TrpC [Actinomycetota bacterium]